MNEYMIIYEKTSTGYSAYSPDMEGCIAVGETREECEKSMKEALKYHIEFLLEQGEDIPKPANNEIGYIKVNTNRKRKLATV
jgi:predicted RNase H-like HicB family nuclease